MIKDFFKEIWEAIEGYGIPPFLIILLFSLITLCFEINNKKYKSSDFMDKIYPVVFITLSSFGILSFFLWLFLHK